jgi:hypothetical protein
MLYFSEANGKLRKLAKKLKIPYAHIRSFDLPSGITCNPSCKFRAVAVGGKLYRKNKNFPSCYAVRSEAFYPNVWRARTRNYAELLGCSENEMVKKIEKKISQFSTLRVLRLHTSGDFFSLDYFRAWNRVAKNHPEIRFYTYTKRIGWYIKMRAELAENFRILASYGSTSDSLITRFKVPFSRSIAFDDATRYNLPINETDLEAYNGVSSIILFH